MEQSAPAAPQPRWRLRARLLIPVLILVLSGAISLSLIDHVLARRQVETLVSQRGATVLEGISQQLAERQRAQGLLARVMAAQPGLGALVRAGDEAGLRGALAAFNASPESESIAVVDSSGREVLRQGAAVAPAAGAALAERALGGAASATSTVDGAALAVLAAAPIGAAPATSGALVVGTRLALASLREGQGQDTVDLALYQDGRLASTTATAPALVATLTAARLSPRQADALDQALVAIDFRATTRLLADDSVLVALVPLQALADESSERTLIVLLGSLELVIALIAVGLLLVRDIAGPLEVMVNAARDMARGQYLQRVGPSPIRELNDLGSAINFLAQQVQQQIAQLTRQAFHDSLSDLPNRALFMDRLERALASADRREGSVAVLFLDLDNFKVVNDSLGHHAGDQLLLAAAKRLSACLRNNDTIARFGGDEFTILLEDVRDIHQVTLVAKRIQGALRAPFAVDERSVFTTASIGIAFSAPGHDEPEILLRDADLAMYRAKQNGRAHYEIFDSGMNAAAMKRLELETDLRNAIQNGELRAYYQPIVELETGRLAGMETLVRWQHPKRGLVSPGEFVPLAEEAGLIVPIGHWVLAEACSQVRAWRDCYPAAFPLTVNVNLSGRQFQHPNLVQEVAQLVQETGIDARYLKLEVTESVTMHDAAAAIGILQQLKGLGLQLAIDDFGTGYSSLAYLRRFPLDTLKIDYSFVRHLEDDPENLAIIRTIVELAKTLHLNVTAEGIETEAQAVALRALGAEYGQGYYYGRPMPAAEIEALIVDAASVPAR
ncbi:MAG TPA: EAL domain-containing protein [Chloroflexota bacterium]|jgi:diguanylate cyclase (GGDEF)-like protein